jgi:hypothetical protein
MERWRWTGKRDGDSYVCLNDAGREVLTSASDDLATALRPGDELWVGKREELEAKFGVSLLAPSSF